MFEVPVVIEPDEVERLPDPEISGAPGDMALGTIVMHILQRGPDEAEAGIHGEVVPKVKTGEPDDGEMEKNGGEALEANDFAIAGIERVEEGGGGLVDVPILFVLTKREEEEDHIAQDDHHIVEAGEDSVENEELPKLMIALKVKIKSLVVGAISQMVAKVALANEVKWGGKEKGHETPGEIVPAPVGKQDGVLGLVDNGIDRIHDHAEDEGEQEKRPAPRRKLQRRNASGNGGQLGQQDGQIEAIGDGGFAVGDTHEIGLRGLRDRGH